MKLCNRIWEGLKTFAVYVMFMLPMALVVTGGL